MTQPAHASLALQELFNLSDEVLNLSGDVLVDSSWYLKRTSLSIIYASTELFITRDTSKQFMDTERFLDRRLDDLDFSSQALNAVEEWIQFTETTGLNILRSRGWRL